jgi:hypothetical protein
MNRNALPHQRRFFFQASSRSSRRPAAFRRESLRLPGQPAEVFYPAAPPTLTDIQQNCRIASL